MWNVLSSFILPPLLVFGLYHLLTWFNVRGINQRVYWKRVALAAAVSHLLLVTGFFVFVYVDYRANREFTAFGLSYGDFLFNRSEFWRLSTLLDTAAMACTVGLFSALDRLEIAPPGVVAMTIGIVGAVGTIQWYFIGGGVGALLERFWSGLKTGDEDDYLAPEDD